LEIETAKRSILILKGIEVSLFRTAFFFRNELPSSETVFFSRNGSLLQKRFSSERLALPETNFF
jgi:hypothetical protein